MFEHPFDRMELLSWKHFKFSKLSLLIQKSSLFLVMSRWNFLAINLRILHRMRFTWPKGSQLECPIWRVLNKGYSSLNKGRLSWIDSLMAQSKVRLIALDDETRCYRESRIGRFSVWKFIHWIGDWVSKSHLRPKLRLSICSRDLWLRE